MSETPYRLASGGQIDRSRPLRFRFDGRQLNGCAGDTLASALLANGIHLVARSFKYHRPRGIVSAGSQEPNALVEFRDGARREPNTRATMVELFDGLEARSQNRFPSLVFDLLAVNQIFSPFFGAGFYYKTFMWPASFWEPVYEKLIRRAAGLGRAAVGPDPDHYEHGHLHADVVIVGAGPAGLMAALAAGRSGARVVVLDEHSCLGGTLLCSRETLDGVPAAEWVAGVVAELDALDNVRVMPRTTLFGCYDHGVSAALERVCDHLPTPGPGLPRQRLWIIRSKQMVLTSGAIERPLVFAGNDLPGVMHASAVRCYLNRFAVAPGRAVVVATNNDEAYHTALDLRDAGVAVTVVADARPQGGEMAERARGAGLRVETGVLPLRAQGRLRVSSVCLGHADGRVFDTIDCDVLAVSGGYDPAIHLLSQGGQTPRWREDLAAFTMADVADGRRPAGAAAGVFDLGGCLRDGLEGGLAAARDSGISALVRPPLPAVTEVAQQPLLPVWRCPATHKGKAFVDLQNDVTVDDVDLAHREGYASIEQLKRYTTLGMGTDQGKTANTIGLALLADARGETIAEVGTTRYRPPYTPVAIGAFAGHQRGRNFQPVRRTALQDWHQRAGASFNEAGLWLRPACYARPGETPQQAIDREAALVRSSVGLCDVSTLGKIEIFGTDTAEFLNRLYINGWSKLAVGKARYGVMLREDGIVFDDGTTSRLAEDHYLMTTTTNNAARVLAHMEYHSQVVWPDLAVAFCSVTEQWCGIAIAGPDSRRLLERVVEGIDVSNNALPFMGVTQGRISGMPVRLFRISFSGELAYEVNTPWRFGEGLMNALMDAGGDFECAPYGVEALSVLRIEKGHFAGPELDGRTTAADLGLGRMMSTRKSCIGQRMSTRPGLCDPARPALVGLKPVDAGQRLRAGAHLVQDPDTADAENSQGWVTSVANSPAVGQWIGLGMLRNGPQRHGERVWAYDPLRGERVEVEIGPGCFVDPQGERLRG